MTFIRSTLLAFALVSVPTHAALATPDYVQINSALASEIIVPAYDRLAAATQEHADQWAKACAHQDDVGRAQLEKSYHRIADAWADGFHWNFGPITFLLRRDKFYHWPERRNAVSKSLRTLLANPDPAQLKPDNFVHISVAAQGLPAMERMLFEYTDTLDNPWSCKVAQTIAANMAEMAAGTAKDWHDDVLPTIQRGDEHPIYFDGPQETLNTLFTQLLTGFTILKDQKILPVLGASAKKAKPGLVEARRSKRFLRNLKHNLKTLLAGDEILSRHIPKEIADDLVQNRNALMKLADALPDFEKAAYDDQGRAQYKAFIDALSGLRSEMVNVYTNHLGLVVGFNSLDGD